MNPGTAGLVVYSPNESTQMVNADIVLSLKKGEIIPPSSLIEVWIDDRRTQTTFKDFIEKTKSDEHKVDVTDKIEKTETIEAEVT